MEGKTWGIILSILGIAGLIGAIIYVNGPEVNDHLAILFVAGIAGAAAFFTGIWLIDHKGARQRARVVQSKLQQQGS